MIDSVSATDSLRDAAAVLMYRRAMNPLAFSHSHPGQERVHSSPAKTRIVCAANRWGKTVLGAKEVWWWMTGTHPYRTTPKPPVTVRVGCTDFTMGISKVVLPELQRWAPNEFLLKGSWEESLRREVREIHLTNGSMCDLVSYDQEPAKLGGVPRDFIWLDEECPQETWEELHYRAGIRYPEFLVTATPVTGVDWYMDLLDNWLLMESTEVFYGSIFENSESKGGFMPDDVVRRLVKAAEESGDPWELEVRVHGRPKRHAGLVYQVDRNVHGMAPLPQWANGVPPKNEFVHFCAIDPGFADPCAVLFVAVGQDRIHYIYDEIYRTHLSIPEVARLIREANERHGFEPHIYLIDPKASKQTMKSPRREDHVFTDYLHARPRQWPVDLKYRIGSVRRLLQLWDDGKPRLFYNPDLKWVSWEFGRYRYPDPSKTTGAGKTDLPLDKHNHLMDCLGGIVAYNASPEGAPKTRKRGQHIRPPTPVTGY